MAAEWTGWLRVNNSPSSRVMDLWNKTAKTRLSFIHLDKPTVDDVITQWPRRGRALAGKVFNFLSSLPLKVQP
jgi:hypothetical protein